MRFEDRAVQAYLTADPRSLACGRIALASVLLVDLLNRTPLIRDLYSNVGLLPNHTLLWRPQGDRVFSLFFMASTPLEATLGFVLCGLAYLFLLVGFRTRLAQVASLLCVVSLHARTFQNGGDYVLSELCFWTMFLPTGRRYSLDSLRRRLVGHDDATFEDLADRSRFAADTGKITSLAVGAVIGQLVLIYLLNAIQKSGPTWKSGAAVHYVLHQDTVVTDLGVWVRGWIRPWQSWLLSRATVLTEASIPLLILCPFARRTTRHIAIVLSLGLHVSFSLLLNLEIFTPAMLAFLPNLLPGEDFDALERRSGRGHQREVILDGRAGVLFQAARVLARLDPGARLTFRPAPVPEPGRADSTAPEPADQALLVITPAGDRRWAGVAALAEIARTLPAGRPLAWLLRLPGVRHLAEVSYRRFARRRFAVSAALGMPGCLPSRRQPEGAARLSEPPALAVGRAWLARLRELMVALLILVALTELIVDNQALRAVAPLNRPAWLGQLTSYLQFPQGWSMFAPDVSRTDMNLSVDALTQDGRHVDPFSEVANPRYPFPGLSIPAALYQNSFLIDYALRIPSIPDYHQAFKEWVLRYPERTGNDRDTIVSFRAYVVEDDSPPPGERQPRNARSRVFLEFTK